MLTWKTSVNRNRASPVARYTASGERDRAIDLYDQAIRLAHDSGFIQNVALGNELAAKFHLRHGRSQVARAYMQANRLPDAERAYIFPYRSDGLVQQRIKAHRLTGGNVDISPVSAIPLCSPAILLS